MKKFLVLVSVLLIAGLALSATEYIKKTSTEKPVELSITGTGRSQIL